MKVNEVVEITKGTLLGTPSISSFARVMCDVGQVQKGDLFIAYNADCIEEARQRGAYGIIAQAPLHPNDDEIAWIVVENMGDCLERFARYMLLARGIKLIHFSPVEEAIAHEILDDSRVRIFNDCLERLLELLSCCDELIYLITHNEQILNLSFDVIVPIKPKDKPFMLLSHTLFDSTIFYKGAHYRLNLPKLFLSELSSVLELFEAHGITFALEYFKYIIYFKPNFLNAFGKIIDYGQASKVAIAEQDIEQFKKYMAYIANNATWGKLLFLVPLPYFDLLSQIAPTFAYTNEIELCQRIYDENFNFALILGIDDNILVNALNHNHRQIHQPRLFEDIE